MYKIEECEKMVKKACEKNDYELYKKACCYLHLHIKLCSESEEERTCFALYDALFNDKSEDFLNVAREIITNDKDPSKADIMVYVLLLSVRVDSEFVMGYLLNICDEIQGEVLKMMLEEAKK